MPRRSPSTTIGENLTELVETHRAFRSSPQQRSARFRITAAFVFEGGHLDQLMQSVVKDPTSVVAFRQWEKLIDGMPRVAREAYHWERESGWAEGWGE
jgi:hypothetical protein